MNRIFYLSLVLGLFYITLNGQVLGQNPVVESAVADYLLKFSSNGTVNLDEWEAPEDMKKHLIYYHSGFDEEDRPIWVAEWGKWDVKKYVDLGGEDIKNYDKYVDQMFLRVIQSLVQKSTPENQVHEVVLIFDVDGYKLEQIPSAGALVNNLIKFANWAPATIAIHKGFIINTNFLAERMVNVIKPILGPSFARFDIYGTNKAKWIPKILKHIPRSQLPEWYGGTKDFVPYKIYG